MIICGHQPNYLPYIGFFHKIALGDIFVIVDNVQYVKRGPYGWINRNKIRTKDSWSWLTVPVISKGKYSQKIIDTHIDNSKTWANKHSKTIELSYKKAPYFDIHKEFFIKLYKTKWEKLSDLNEAIIRYIISSLGIKVEIVKASEMGASGKGTDLIIDMCKKLKANSYIHGKHGKDYIDINKFTDNNIKCLYQEFNHPVYKQIHEPFLAEMSIIDLLFNKGPESLDIIKASGNLQR